MNDLDVATPDQLIGALRKAAEEFAHSQTDLQAAWQDPKAGNFWGYASKELEKVANRLEKKWAFI